MFQPSKHPDSFGLLHLEYSQVWRDDILPCPAVVRICLEAADTIDARDNFLSTTMLADRAMSLKEYSRLVKSTTQLESQDSIDSYNQFKGSPFWFV